MSRVRYVYIPIGRIGEASRVVNRYAFRRRESSRGGRPTSYRNALTFKFTAGVKLSLIDAFFSKPLYTIIALVYHIDISAGYRFSDRIGIVGRYATGFVELGRTAGSGGARSSKGKPQFIAGQRRGGEHDEQRTERRAKRYCCLSKAEHQRGSQDRSDGKGEAASKQASSLVVTHLPSAFFRHCPVTVVFDVIFSDVEDEEAASSSCFRRSAPRLGIAHDL